MSIYRRERSRSYISKSRTVSVHTDRTHDTCSQLRKENKFMTRNGNWYAVKTAPQRTYRKRLLLVWLLVPASVRRGGNLVFGWKEKKREIKTDRKEGVYWRWRNRLERGWLRFYRRRRSFSIQTRHRENCFSNLELELEVVAVVALNKWQRMSFDANLTDIKDNFIFVEGENFRKFSLIRQSSIKVTTGRRQYKLYFTSVWNIYFGFKIIVYAMLVDISSLS